MRVVFQEDSSDSVALGAEKGLGVQTRGHWDDDNKWGWGETLVPLGEAQ